MAIESGVFTADIWTALKLSIDTMLTWIKMERLKWCHLLWSCFTR